MINEKDLAKTITNKTIRVWLWLAYKFTENDCRLQLFLEFIQTRKRYPTYLDKISVLTWKLLVISCQNFPCNLNSQITFSLQDTSYLSPRLWKYKLCCGFKRHWWVCLNGSCFCFLLNEDGSQQIHKYWESTGIFGKRFSMESPTVCWESKSSEKMHETSLESQSFKWIWWNFNSWF